jgi:hypothetical protein
MNKSIGTETIREINPVNVKLAQGKARHDDSFKNRILL